MNVCTLSYMYIHVIACMCIMYACIILCNKHNYVAIAYKHYYFSHWLCGSWKLASCYQFIATNFHLGQN